jgi:lysozyme family protein
MTNDDIIAAILKHEGGFVNHPEDRRGPTSFGITQDTLSAWRGELVTELDIKALTEAEAKEIYLAVYLYGPGFGKIGNGPLRHLAVDSGVQHGSERVVRWIQTLVGATVDGKLGPRTAAAINAAEPVPLFKRLLARRIRFYGGLISAASSQAVFAAGWANRAASFLDA